MKKILLTLPIVLLAACDSLPSRVGDVSYKKLDEVNYEVTIVGKSGVSREKLRAQLDEKMKTLCGMPYLPRHHKEETTSSNSYTITLGGQCFTKQDMLDYEKSVADAKKGGKGKAKSASSKAKAKKK